MPHKMMNSQIADVLHDNRLSIEARIALRYERFVTGAQSFFNHQSKCNLITVM